MIKIRPLWIAVGVVAVLLSALALVLLRHDRGQNDVVQDRAAPEAPMQNEKVFLQVDQGHNVSHAPGGARIVSERYRFLDTREGTAMPKTLNISTANATLTLTRPDGVSEDVTSELWYYPFTILPPSPEGTYMLTAVLRNGETYTGTFSFLTPERVEAVDGAGNFVLANWNISGAESAFHVSPDNYVVYTEEDSFDVSRLAPGTHFFFAKIGDRWHYAAITSFAEDGRVEEILLDHKE
jgi:hypothetical protein